MTSPYDTLTERAFWRSGVATAPVSAPPALYQPKFKITPKCKIMTAGSSFAQHVHGALNAHDWSVLETEDIAKFVSPDVANKYGYGFYCARYGDIQTPRQLIQLLHEACGDYAPSMPVWSRDGRYFDAQRPTTEPSGYASPEDCQRARRYHLSYVRKALEKTNVFVFTLGGTEAWVHGETATVYPTASGEVADAPCPENLEFYNFSYDEILTDLRQILGFLKGFNPNVKLVLTVSPEPITATASTSHVLKASTYSKSTLRAAAGQISKNRSAVDYFPAYELLTSPASGNQFFHPDLCSITEEGVRACINMFFGAHDPDFDTDMPSSPREIDPCDDDDELICEEALLEAMSR